MTDNRTTELRISEPLRGFIRHQSNRAYIDGGQSRWLTEIADEIDAKHEQAVDDARIVEVETSYIDIEQGEVITRFVPEQAIAATLGTPISADLRTALDFMRIWITDDAHLGESAISYEFEKAEGLRKLEAIEQAIAATLGSGTCEIALARLVDVAAKVDIDSCAEILECVEAIRKAVKR